MRRDPIAELYQIARLLNPDRGELMIAGWVNRFVQQYSSRQFSGMLKEKEAKRFQAYTEEKLLAELTSKLVADCSFTQTDETETANIVTKSILVLGERKT